MKRLPALLLVLLAAGCAESADKYPSLALRPIESRSDAVVVTPTPAATPDAALDSQIATQAAKLAQIDQDFAAGAARAESAAKARGALAVGSDQWVAAQGALAELEGLRGDTLGMASDLERMTIDRATAGEPPYPALDALLGKAQAQLNGELARIAAVKAMLGEK
ncbi:hypothetical protein [Sphingomonas sp.]|jgi:hypothetical protein|uniref:hypothetical protein n=1 Tax=Sphingomonas sp. TaxID=28214 RepID=UPI002E36D5C2|nr:hypothetical protein [Sphingomonas sp.]HEX4693419.1 hypothetical protein [Sphingomonas sp.]